MSYGAVGIVSLLGIGGALFAKKKCSRDVDGGEDGTIDADILEDDYQNEGTNDAKDDETDVEMSYTKYEENSSKAVNFSLSQAPLD